MLEHLFVQDRLPIGYLPIYDKEREQTAWIIDQGKSVAMVHGNRVIVPMEIPHDELDDRVYDLVLSAAQAQDPIKVNSFDNIIPHIRQIFADRDLELSCVLSAEPHTFRSILNIICRHMPSNIIIALTYPEFLGRIVCIDSHNYGLLIHNPRGIVLMKQDVN